MNSDNIEVILKRFERPDEIRILTKGKFEIVRLGGMTIGRATYEPGWRWSEHVGPSVGASRCQIEHVGMVLAGTATAAFDDGRVVELQRGDLFHTHRFRTIAGWSATNLTSPFTSWGPTIMPNEA
jgi:hypothetical protein